MSMEWIHESTPVWDTGKAEVIDASPEGAFSLKGRPGELVPGDWWRVEKDGKIAGYGWMDTNWGGDAEVLLAVHPSFMGQGVGTFILEQLEIEAAAQGLNYLFNVVSATHPDAERVTAWLTKRHFKPSHEGRLMRAVVHPKR